MTESPQIIKIDPDGKYVFVLPDDVGEDVALEFTRELQEWWEGSSPILVTFDTVKIQKIEKGGE